jgi:nitrate reductase NapE component
MTDITRADFDQLRNEITQQFTSLRIEWRQEMLTHIRWLVGLFVVQFIATVGATAGIVGWMLNIAGRHM